MRDYDPRYDPNVKDEYVEAMKKRAREEEERKKRQEDERGKR